MRKRLCRLMTKKNTIKESKNQILKVSSSEKEKVNFQCHRCEFECQNKVTLNKYTNTKHDLNESDKDFAVSYNKSECSLSVKEHLIDHVNQSKEDQYSYVEEEVMPKKRLIDEYDDDGNYIGDDPCFMDSEPDTEDDE